MRSRITERLSLLLALLLACGRAAATEATPTRGPAPLLPQTLERALHQLEALVVPATSIEAVLSPNLLWALAAGLAAGLILGLPLRRTGARLAAPERKPAASRWRVFGRGLATVLRRRAFSLTLPLGLIAGLEAMGARATPAGYLAEVALGLWAVYRVGIALIPILWPPLGEVPAEPQPIHPGAYRLWLGGRGLFALALATGFLALAAERLSVGSELRSVGTLLITVAALPVLWLMRDRSGWRHAGGRNADEPLPPLREGLLRLWRLAAAVLALGLPILAIIGHTQLAGMLLLNLLLTILILLVTGLIAAGLGRGLGRLKQARPPQAIAPVVTPTRLTRLVSLAQAGVHVVVILAGLTGVLALWQLPVQPVWEVIKPALFGFRIGSYELSLVGIAAGVAVFIAGLYVGRWVRNSLHYRMLPRFGMDEGMRNSIASLTYYVILVLGALLAVSVAGFDLTNLAIIAGALSVGIGFGLQNVVNNFVSGLILLFERPIKLGDVVEYQGIWAEVAKIRVRSTVVRTFDRAELIVPNSELVSTTVTNWTHSDSGIRITLPIGVAYGSDTGRVRDLLLQTAQEHPQIFGDPPPLVLFREFGDSALQFELRCFTHLDYYLTAASDLRFRVDELFRENGIAIPFPQRDVHFYGTDGAPEPAPAS